MNVVFNRQKKLSDSSSTKDIISIPSDTKNNSTNNDIDAY